MVHCCVFPQTLQVLMRTPVVSGPASVCVVKSLQLWPAAGMGIVSVFPHTVQVLVCSPSSVQADFFVTT